MAVESMIEYRPSQSLNLCFIQAPQLISELDQRMAETTVTLAEVRRLFDVGSLLGDSENDDASLTSCPSSLSLTHSLAT